MQLTTPGVWGSILFFLVRQECWEGLVAWLSRKTAWSDYVDLADMDLMEIVDDPAEVVAKADRWQHLKGHDNV